MPIMWFVKDGFHSDAQTGTSTAVSYEEIRDLLAANKPEYISKEPPQFYIESPSRYPVRVLIEIRPEDGTSEEFHKIGFYLIPGISPERAQQLLAAYRGRKMK